MKERDMRKLLLVCSLFFSATLLSAQNRDFSKVQVKVQKVAGTVYMLQGAGGNIGVSVGNDGLLMVDTEFAQIAEKIDAALKQLSPRPPRFVIDTHWHQDHTGGNAYFHEHGAIIVAQENVRRILASGTMRDGIKYEPAPKDALPTFTYANRANLYMNGEQVRLYHVPHAHTDGDTVVYFATSHVLQTGDDFRTDGFPLIDSDNGGSVRGMIAADQMMLATFPADARVIPGHGGLSTMADIKPFLAMLQGCRERMERGIRQGKSLEELKKEKVLAPYQSFNRGLVSMDRFTEVLYRELTEKKSSRAR
jgi:cyclase